MPVDRYDVPEAVAVAAVYLALRQSGYITGVTLPVDGGFVSSGTIKRGWALATLARRRRPVMLWRESSPTKPAARLDRAPLLCGSR